MSETQYNNLINIITNYPQMPVSQVFNAEMSEANIMAALFSNTFTVGEGVSGYFLKYKYTDAYSDLESRVLYYNNDMVKLAKPVVKTPDPITPLPKQGRGEKMCTTGLNDLGSRRCRGALGPEYDSPPPCDEGQKILHRFEDGKYVCYFRTSFDDGPIRLNPQVTPLPSDQDEAKATEYTNWDDDFTRREYKIMRAKSVETFTNSSQNGPSKNKSIVDMDISYYNTQNIIKYYFLLDLLSEFYGYLANNRATNKITIRSRYTIVNGEWGLANEVFTFDIQFRYATMDGVSGYMIVNAKGEDIKIVTDMCDIFKNDIVRHLNYLNKEDITRGNKEYLQNVQAFYKFCRLKTIYYTLLCAAEVNKSVNDFINFHLAYCFLNLKNSIPMKAMDSQSMALANQMMTSTAKLQDYNLNIGKKNDVVKKNLKIRRTYENYYMKIVFYAIVLISIIFGISAYIIYNFSDQNRSDNFIALSIIVLTIVIYIIMHYFAKINTIERFETTTTVSSGKNIRKFPITPATSNKYQSVGSKGDKVNIVIKGSSSLKINDQWRLFDGNTDTVWESEEYTLLNRTYVEYTYGGSRYGGYNDDRNFINTYFQRYKTDRSKISIFIDLNLIKNMVGDFVAIDVGEKLSIVGYSIKSINIKKMPNKFKLLATNKPDLFDILPLSFMEVPGWDIIDEVSQYSYKNEGKMYYSYTNYDLKGQQSEHPFDVSSDSGIYVKENRIGLTDDYYITIPYQTEPYTLHIPNDTECDILVAGGGGSGGTRNGGGGGAGACIYVKKYLIKSGYYEVTIGKGGDSVPSGPSRNGNNGGDTKIRNIETNEIIYLAKGGGGGGGGMSGQGTAGISGGSSGGSSVDKATKTISPVSTENIPSGAYGYEGGYGNYGEYNMNGMPGAGGGGGGAGGTGKNAYVKSFGSGITCIGGDGGPGLQYDITGSNVYYCTGGGGGVPDISKVSPNKVHPGLGGSYLGGVGYYGNNKTNNMLTLFVSKAIVTNRNDLRNDGSDVRIGVELTNELSYINIYKDSEYISFLNTYVNSVINKSGINVNEKNINGGTYMSIYHEKGAWKHNNAHVGDIIYVILSENYNGNIPIGSGGGGGGTLRGNVTDDQANDNSSYNGQSQGGGNGVVIIRYTKSGKIYNLNREYRYYALVMYDRVSDSEKNYQLSEIEFYGGNKEDMRKIETSVDLYGNLLNPGLEITAEIQAAIDKAKAKLKEKMDIENANAEKLRLLQKELDNVNTSNYMVNELERIRQETLKKELEAAEAKKRADAAETARARDELLANEQEKLKKEAEAQKNLLQNQVNTLTSNSLILRDLEEQLKLPANGSNLLLQLQQNLITAELQKKQAEDRLAISKTQEAADKLLIDQEKAINNDYATQLSGYLLNLSQARKRKEDADAAKQQFKASITQASLLQQQIIEAELEAATAEVRKQNQIYLTNQARLAAEAKQALANSRKQILETLTSQLADITSNYNTTESDVLKIIQQNSELQYGIDNAVEYTSNYLIGSSNQYSELASTRYTTITSLESDIANIKLDITKKLEEIKTNIRNSIEDRAASEDIKKNITTLAMELSNYMIENQNYKYSASVLSVTKSSEDIKTKMSLNIQTTMTQIANNIVLAGVNREMVDMTVQNDESVIAAEKSRGDVEEMRRDNLITVATCKFILNLFVLSVILMMIHQKFSLGSLIYLIIIIYIVLFTLYIMEVLRIVHTRSFHKYWQKPGQRQFL